MVTVACTTTVGGIATVVSQTFTFDGDSATGAASVETRESTGKVLLHCTYDFTMTKR
jgi:hypothetical protein